MGHKPQKMKVVGSHGLAYNLQPPHSMATICFPRCCNFGETQGVVFQVLQRFQGSCNLMQSDTLNTTTLPKGSMYGISIYIYLHLVDFYCECR